MIDKITEEKILEEAQSHITDVVSEFVSVSEVGQKLIIRCPLHHGDSPTLSVYPDRGIFKCSECKKGGNAVNFVMDLEQVSYQEALTYLAEKFNIQIDKTESQEIVDDKQGMRAVSEFAQKYFKFILHKSDEGRSVGMSYLKSRGFSDDIIEKFQLGYSPDSRSTLTDEAIKNGYRLPHLERSGLSIVRDDYKADRFRGRVIFPIHNVLGKATAFGGRVLKQDDKTAKYLNSPESEIYHKSKILYGIYQAKAEIGEKDRCFLVEGYTDVISFHQAGIFNVVASSGTALTVDQIRLISRYTNNITIIYDGDPAGIKASLRGIDLVLEQGMTVKVLLLPEGEDPDSFSKSRNADELQEYIAQHEGDFINFKTGLLLQDAKKDPIKRAQLLQDVIRSISVIPNRIERAKYIKECSVLLGTKEEIIYNEIGKITTKRRQEKYKKSFGGPDPFGPSAAEEAALFGIQNPFETEEREIIRFLIKFGHLDLYSDEEEVENITVGEFILHQLKEDELESVDPLYKMIMDLYAENYLNANFEAPRFFAASSNKQVSLLASDLLHETTLSKIHSKFGSQMKNEGDALSWLVPKLVHELKLKKVKRLIEEYRNVLKKAQEARDDDKMMEAMQIINRFQTIQSALSKELGGRTII